jgi:hypothetical protein
MVASMVVTMPTRGAQLAVSSNNDDSMVVLDEEQVRAVLRHEERIPAIGLSETVVVRHHSGLIYGG